MAWRRDKTAWWREERRRLRFSILLAVAALTVLVIVGTISMHYLEDWTWISCFYFSVTTLATVGYGDLHPSSDTSRLFVSVYVIAGVTTALSAMTVVGRNYLTLLEHHISNLRAQGQRAQRSLGPDQEGRRERHSS